VGIGERRALGDVEISSGNVKLAMSHVVPDIIQKILRGQNPVHILGDGSQVRHYTYGGDLAKGIVLAMESEAALNEDFNLSTAESTTVLQLVTAIWEKINPGVDLKIVNDPGYEYDVNKRVPSVEKAKNILGFEAKTSLSSMLDTVIPWISKAIEENLI
jgi:nucleoside-diphosphate-sugar epimerase